MLKVVLFLGVLFLGILLLVSCGTKEDRQYLENGRLEPNTHIGDNKHGDVKDLDELSTISSNSLSKEEIQEAKIDKDVVNGLTDLIDNLSIDEKELKVEVQEILESNKVKLGD